MEPEAKVRWVLSDAGESGVGVPRIPSLFGQLIALASQGRAQSEQKGKPDGSISEAWQAAFLRWLRLDLAHQKADLDAYAAWLGTEASGTLSRQCLADPGLLVPDAARAVERRLFVSDTRALLALEGCRPTSRQNSA